MHDFDAGLGRQAAGGHSSAQWVFFFSKMADNAGLESPFRFPRRRCVIGFCRLIDDARFVMKPLWQVGKGELLQAYQASRDLKRAPGARISADVAIEIGPGQDDDQRELRVELVEFVNRRVTAARVKRDQDIAARALIALLNSNFMTELA